MATYTPPTEILPIFDSSVYVADTTPLTIGEANKKYVKYPTAQGITTFPSGLKTDTISPISESGNLTLFNGGLGNIYIGTSSSSITLGMITAPIFFNNLYSSVSGIARNIYPTGTDTINLGSLSTAINIGINSASSSSITLGSSTSIINALGSVLMNLINPSTSTTIMNIGTTNTVDMNIGTNTSRTGTLHLGDGDSSSGGIHINNGTSSTGNTQIMNGTSGSGTLNLGSTAVGNSVVINVNRPLSLTYKPSVTSVGTLGYVYSPTYTWRTTANQSVASQALPIGVYQMTFSISLTGTFTALYLYISGVVLPTTTYKFPLISSVSFSICSGSAIIRCNTAQTFDLIVSTNNSLVGASGNGEVNIVRIG
jgi:hypothetical protein